MEFSPALAIARNKKKPVTRHPRSRSSRPSIPNGNDVPRCSMCIDRKDAVNTFGTLRNIKDHSPNYLRPPETSPERPRRSLSALISNPGTRQPRSNIPERHQCGLKMVNDFLLQDIRRRQVIEVFEAVIL